MSRIRKKLFGKIMEHKQPKTFNSVAFSLPKSKWSINHIIWTIQYGPYSMVHTVWSIHRDLHLQNHQNFKVNFPVLGRVVSGWFWTVFRKIALKIFFTTFHVTMWYINVTSMYGRGQMGDVFKLIFQVINDVEPNISNDLIYSDFPWKFLI